MPRNEEVKENSEGIVNEFEAEGKVNRFLEGTTHGFAGKASLMQFFQNGFHEKRILPMKIALYDEDRTMTFQELDILSSKLAIVLKDALGPFENRNPDGDIVFGICAPPTDKLIVLIFAIMKLGAAYVPFDVTFPENRVVRIVSVVKPVMIISDNHEATLSKFNPVKLKTLVLTLQELLERCESVDITTTYVPLLPSSSLEKLHDKTAIVLFTSGSSGEPKGVRLSHRTVLDRLNWHWHEFPFKNDDSCCFKTALTFVDSVPEIFCPLLLGRHLVVLSKNCVTQSHIFVQKIQEHKITRLNVVPSFLANLLTLMDVLDEKNTRLEALDSVKMWTCSGETLTRDLLERFFTHFPQGHMLCNYYGSTEVGDVTFETFESRKDIVDKCVGDQDQGKVSLGAPTYNSVVYILDENMEMAEDGEVGEIILAGYNLAQGYVGIRDSDKFIFNYFSKTPGFNRLYRTGDYGHIQHIGNGRRALFYDGRVDSQIKVRGHRVDLSEIETVIRDLSKVSKCVVLPYHAGENDQTVVAFCVPGFEGTKENIEFNAKTKLLPCQMPKICIIKEIPYLVNGKVDRQRLLREYHEERTKRNVFDDWDKLDIAKDKIPSLKTLIETISKVTGTPIQDIVENLDISFYNLGGTSLNSLMVIQELKKLQYIIVIHEFVAAQTIRELHQRMRVENDAMSTVDTKIGSEAREKFLTETLSNLHKTEVMHILGYSFAYKGILEIYVPVPVPVFEQMLESIWAKLVATEHSFVVRRKSDSKIIGVSLNFDLNDEPDDVMVSGGLEIIFEFLEYMEAPHKEALPKGLGTTLHQFMMGTHEDLSEAENVFLIEFMEEEIIRLGNFHNFGGLFATNTNPLTQQIGIDVHGYTILSELKINQYVNSKGTKPFLLAPDTQKVIVCWKKIHV